MPDKPIHCAVKTIYNGVVLHLVNGESARIQSAPGKVIVTSPVKHTVKSPSGMVKIVTQNSIYNVFP